MRRNVVIIHPGALGDVLLALPAMRALRASFPLHEHLLIASSEVGKLLQTCAEVDRAIAIEGSAFATLLAAGATVPADLRAYLNRCDLFVCWMGDAGGDLASTLHGLGAQRVIFRSPFDGQWEGLHQSDRFLETVRDVIRPGDYRSALRLPGSAVTRARGLITGTGGPGLGVVALHPGSGSQHKCCQPSLFGAACRELFARSYTPILLGGPADDTTLAGAVTECTEPPPIFTGLDLVSIAGLLAYVDLYVGHDSGLTHLAAALHRPTIALFGPTQVQRWAPNGDHVRILTGDTCRCHTWAEVRNCQGKPCLDIAAERLIHACAAMIHQHRPLDADPVWSGPAPCSDR